MGRISSSDSVIRSFLNKNSLMKRCNLALRISAFVVLIALCLTGQTKKFAYTSGDKAFFADPALVNFVRPGLVITINSAQITSTGVITMTYTLTDPFGLPLDAAGVTTRGVRESLPYRRCSGNCAQWTSLRRLAADMLSASQACDRCRGGLARSRLEW